MLQNIKENKKFNKGFTLLETVIATSIVMFGIIGLLIVSQDSVLTVYFARDRLTASYLAKEGMEIVRNIRDRNLLVYPPRPWNSGLSLGRYEVQYDSVGLIGPIGDLIPLRPLRIDATGFYGYLVGTETKFTREINISPVLGRDAIKVEVRVHWEDYDFLLVEHLYNWR